MVVAALVVAVTYSPSATFSGGGLQVDNNLTQANTSSSNSRNTTMPSAQSGLVLPDTLENSTTTINVDEPTTSDDNANDDDDDNDNDDERED